MTLTGQLGGEVPRRFRGPPQRRHRIATFVRLDQSHQRGTQPGIQVHSSFPAAARPADPAQRCSAGIEFIDAQRDGRFPHPGGRGHRPDSAMTQHPRFSPQPEPALPLIKVRTNRLEPRRDLVLNLHRNAHNRSTDQNPASYGLFLCEP
jgi:hypothetical protein